MPIRKDPNPKTRGTNSQGLSSSANCNKFPLAEFGKVFRHSKATVVIRMSSVSQFGFNACSKVLRIN